MLVDGRGLIPGLSWNKKRSSLSLVMYRQTAMPCREASNNSSTRMPMIPRSNTFPVGTNKMFSGSQSRIGRSDRDAGLSFDDEFLDPAAHECENPAEFQYTHHHA
jgi:hypothetical protein